jgi:hypothetical protein
VPLLSVGSTLPIMPVMPKASIIPALQPRAEIPGHSAGGDGRELQRNAANIEPQPAVNHSWFTGSRWFAYGSTRREPPLLQNSAINRSGTGGSRVTTPFSYFSLYIGQYTQYHFKVCVSAYI